MRDKVFRYAGVISPKKEVLSTILPALRAQGSPSLTNPNAICQSSLICCSPFVIAFFFL